MSDYYAYVVQRFQQNSFAEPVYMDSCVENLHPVRSLLISVLEHFGCFSC